MASAVILVLLGLGCGGACAIAPQVSTSSFGPTSAATPIEPSPTSQCDRITHDLVPLSPCAGSDCCSDSRSFLVTNAATEDTPAAECVGHMTIVPRCDADDSTDYQCAWDADAAPAGADGSASECALTEPFVLPGSPDSHVSIGALSAHRLSVPTEHERMHGPAGSCSSANATRASPGFVLTAAANVEAALTSITVSGASLLDPVLDLVLVATVTRRPVVAILITMVGATSAARKNFYSFFAEGVGAAIFSDWAHCHPWALGQSMACFRGHGTLEEAKQAVAISAGFTGVVPEITVDAWPAQLALIGGNLVPILQATSPPPNALPGPDIVLYMPYPPIASHHDAAAPAAAAAPVAAAAAPVAAAAAPVAAAALLSQAAAGMRICFRPCSAW